MRPGRGRTLALGLVSALGGLLLVLAALEVLCRFLPVNQTLQSPPVDADCPVLRFMPGRTTRWSKGSSFCLVNTVHANNYGFISNVDYDPGSNLPLVGIIGDSFIEALMVPWERTTQARLAQELGAAARVYAFARSGAPLSQYLAYAQWAKTTFRPDKLVVLVISNDYDESLLEYKSAPGFHYYEDTPQGLRLVRRDYQPGPFSGIVSRSALLMYLLTNMQAQELLQQLAARFSQERFAGQTAAVADEHRLAASRRAVDQFLTDLPEMAGLSGQDICLAVNALIPDLYTAEGMRQARGSYAARMREYFLGQARARGFHVLDLQPVFELDFARNRLPFDYPGCDGHWNERAHGLFAQALLDSGFFRGISRPARARPGS